LLVASTVIIVVVGAAVFVAARSGRGGHAVVSVNPHTTRTSETTPSTGWHRVENPPYPNAVAGVRVGNQVVVAFSLPEGLRFAAFDPVGQRWDKLPTPPLNLQAPFAVSPTFAIVGGSIIVWGHDQTQPPDTSAGSMRIMEYQPATTRWHVLPVSPIHTLIQATPIWTGSELIVWGGNEVNNVAEAFNPTLRQWHRLPNGPLHPREDPVAVWTGTEMLVWGGFPYGSDPAEGAAFNPRTNTWRVLPSSGLSTREVAATAWTGQLFVVWGGSASGPNDPSDGAEYNPTTNRWHAVAAALIAGREQAAVTWTGQDLFIWGGISFNHGRQTLSDGATYNPTTNRWTVLPPSPLVSRRGAVTIWTGNEILLVDGYGPSRPREPSEPALTDAAVYRPNGAT
jgi:N-acetylneuraminic acid mutarotase